MNDDASYDYDKTPSKKPVRRHGMMTKYPFNVKPHHSWKGSNRQKLNEAFRTSKGK